VERQTPEENQTMPRTAFNLVRLPMTLGLMLALTFVGACSSGRTSQPEPSGDSTETTAMDTTADTTADKAAPQDCTYKTTQLSAPTQIQIDCSNGTSLVVRQRADGKWEQEARAVAGARPTYASVELAAKALCCR
jgi:hypothetical protein